MTPATSTRGQASRRYFTAEDTRLLIGKRVRARTAKNFPTNGSAWGTVAYFASGPEPGEYILGVRWDDPRPVIPRSAPYPLDWYTVEEYRDLLGVAVDEAA
ncbi:MAG: hypothetical protein M3436_17015 [Pseudomonadota bacterium]|nr:hypothetical protein [Pseudomonadota bacterium]